MTRGPKIIIALCLLVLAGMGGYLLGLINGGGIQTKVVTLTATTTVSVIKEKQDCDRLGGAFSLDAPDATAPGEPRTISIDCVKIIGM